MTGPHEQRRKLQQYLKEHTCEAGRRADFGGRWTLPCLQVAIHVIVVGDSQGVDDIEPVRLCDDHFEEVNAAGLVDEPFIDPAEAERRMAQPPAKVRRDLQVIRQQQRGRPT